MQEYLGALPSERILLFAVYVTKTPIFPEKEKKGKEREKEGRVGGQTHFCYTKPDITLDKVIMEIQLYFYTKLYLES